MKLLVGWMVVIGCTLGGFLMHHGQMILLFVPTEYLIICGMATGILIASNPVRVIKGVVTQGGALFASGGPGRKQYVEMLQMIYELMQLARKEGVLALEGHVEKPRESSIIGKYPSFAKDPSALAFLCDTLKVFVAGVLDTHAIDELMETDLERMHEEELEPSKAMQAVADALPAIGIVAAVLGIILTMQAIDEGAAVVGVKVAGALVGTFLGVFLAYGIVGPVAGSMSALANERDRYRHCMRHVLTASVSGVAPPMAVEIGRRSIFMSQRPSFEELEEALREAKG